MSAKPTKDARETVGTTGHVWDGIEELNNPMPRWWLWTFYATIFWAVIYTILYPAWPLLNGATPGLLGWSTRANVAAEMAAFNAANAPMRERLVAADLTAINSDPELLQFATNAGASVFRTNCSQCHGSGAAGVQAGGFPNLLDDDWLWGGSINDILMTVIHGIRNTSDPEARYSEMPAFGKDKMLEPAQIDAVVQFVMSLTNAAENPALVPEGKQVFAENCASCHGDNGKGNREFGAPNLTDAIWLYGGDKNSITYSVANARFGVMPNWNTRLSEADMRSVAVYVHGLGGGE
ncbi:MAG: cytochrome-c oxidase, cbb3-type subunit III [Cereibacter sphaeroides]|uniref:Cbb3-type cytochrome c oxidase subunit n=1 Tax=Cereibacter sphaeroides TaxID=1063 RepID=A0A2W5SMG2_CERSP|nr:MAG: cytochrome-c oxidase, cbb3-type subunit III [Cereibacter sphaeroides]